MIAVQNTTADLQTKLAELTSNQAMEERAQTLGYLPVDQNQIEYVMVPGYVEPKPDIPVGAPALRPSAPSIPPQYTESLLEWFDQRLHTLPPMDPSGVAP